MRIVICDEDAFMREMVESIIGQTGHELAGIADSAADAVGLVGAARPDAVVLDLTIDFGTDFDVAAAAVDAGAQLVVFSQNTDADLLSRFASPPVVVAKPDFRALEDALARLTGDAPTTHDDGPKVEERRQHPGRAASGPVPTGVTDAQAFFEAVNGAEPGDALVSLDVPAGAEAVADEVARRMRATDRVLLLLPRAVRFYLPDGGLEGVRSLLGRVAGIPVVSADCRAVSVIVAEGEHGADAFARLKHHGEPQPIS